MQKTDNEFDSRLDFIAMRLLARPLDQKERRVARKTYESFLNFYRANLDKAQQLLDTGDSHPDRNLPEVESAALTMVASQIMNLDEMINK